MWRTTGGVPFLFEVIAYFNPRPPCGGRRGGRSWVTQRRRISIHVLRVEDDLSKRFSDSIKNLHFNPRPPCGGRLPVSLETPLISHFNPRPPCGGRQPPRFQSGVSDKFQSTSSVWRTTGLHCLVKGKPTFQSTSSVWRTTVENPHPLLHIAISIHVLRVEDDSRPGFNLAYQINFNPRPPCGGRPLSGSSKCTK